MLIQILFSLGLAHANPDPIFHWAWHMLIQIQFFTGLGTCQSRSFFHWACLTSQLKSMPVVFAVTQAIWFFGGIVTLRSVLDAWGCCYPLPSSLFGHNNPVYSCRLNSSGVSLFLSQVVLSLGGTYSIISSPQKIANKNLFCMCSQTCPRQAPKESTILPAVKALAKIEFKFQWYCLLERCPLRQVLAWDMVWLHWFYCCILLHIIV